MLLLSVGIYGMLLDWNMGKQELIPKLPFFSFFDEKQKYTGYLENEPSPYPIVERVIKISSAWNIFIIFGILLFITELHDIKSEYLLFDYLKIIKQKGKNKLIKEYINYLKWRTT